MDTVNGASVFDLVLMYVVADLVVEAGVINDRSTMFGMVEQAANNLLRVAAAAPCAAAPMGASAAPALRQIAADLRAAAPLLSRLDLMPRS